MNSNQFPESLPPASRRTFLKTAVPVVVLGAAASHAFASDPKSEANGELIKKFVAVFEKKDTELMKPFFHDDVVFENYGTPNVQGVTNLLALWSRIFKLFETVKFETIHQAVNGDFVLEEQIHHLGFKGKKAVPIMNMAIYEFKAGKIVAWRDYTDSAYSRKLLDR